MNSVAALAKELGLNCHIDGARLMNAAVALATADGSNPIQKARALCAGFDSVSLCLSKGLGAPVGSLLLGNQAFIQQARRLRKMLGGGMRQAGVLAAAGLYALQHNIDRLAEDHQHAQQLAEGLQRIAAEHPLLKGKLELVAVNTNILFTDIALDVAEPLLAYMAQQGIKLTSSNYNKADQHFKRMRWVTHLDISAADIQHALSAVQGFSG